MRRGIVIGVTLLGIAAAVLIAVGAYHAGAHHTVVQQTQGGEVVRVVGPGYYGHWGWGFFPGFLLFPLILFGFFFLMRGLFWGRRWGGPGGPGGYSRGLRLGGEGAGCSRTGTSVSTSSRPATIRRPEASHPQRKDGLNANGRGGGRCSPPRPSSTLVKHAKGSTR